MDVAAGQEPQTFEAEVFAFLRGEGFDVVQRGVIMNSSKPLPVGLHHGLDRSGEYTIFIGPQA
jgi:hypothetical protein